MTTIAWDGHTLAADKQSTCGGLIHTTTKIFKHATGLYGITGHFAHGMSVYKWVTEQGADPKSYPPNPSNDDYGYLLHIDKDGAIWCYEGFRSPVKMEDPFFAIGSGCEYATAAMYCGQTAIGAVQVATKLDTATGQGVDSFTLEDICASL